MKYTQIISSAILLCTSVMADFTTVTPDEINEQMIHSENTSFSMGLTGGTLGLGLNISTAVNDFMSLRVNVNGFKYEKSDDSRYSSFIDADKTYTLDTKGLLLDIYLWQLRVTGGVYLNNNAIDYLAKPEGNNAIILNGTGYKTNALKQIESTISFANIAPYVGVGWGNHSARDGFSMTLDVGLMYHGNPTIDINVKTNPLISPELKAQLLSNLEAEKKIQENDLSDFPFYPVVMVGVSYSF